MNKFLLLSILIILIFSFYWFEYRPSIAREECNKIVLKELSEDWQSPINPGYNNLYEACLHQKGIK